MKYRAGDWVRVKTAREIARTLDPDGRLDGLPFMPEMTRHCGRVYRVSQTAHKTCDTVNKTGGRRLEDAVHLEDLRCDGSAHGGCEAYCLYFWKNAWLEPAGANADPADDPDAEMLTPRLKVADDRDGTTRYECQATLLPGFTDRLPWWNPTQYARDLISGNVGVGDFARTALLQFLRNRMNAGPGYNLWRRLHNAVNRLIGGGVELHAGSGGDIPKGQRTPHEASGLQPGDLVEVKPFEEIRRTLDAEGRNRGMRFDIEMRPFSGQRFRVAQRVSRIIDERSGELVDMKTPSVILEGVYCRSRFSANRLFCPRRLPPFWREIWLERVDEIPLRDATEQVTTENGAR